MLDTIRVTRKDEYCQSDKNSLVHIVTLERETDATP